ncbi:hypothetical protein E2C01_093874 [Portunus trituberculatus]|uniref:Uncharacterized protein n=1 Tax=Portunus trituberculatus TaxID=210409 RepID=A0A5B7JKA3_PORTR|nr:hypothetical protein [Portunus trituberculatus]
MLCPGAPKASSTGRMKCFSMS